MQEDISKRLIGFLPFHPDNHLPLAEGNTVISVGCPQQPSGLLRNMPAIVAINLFQCALALSINIWPCLLPLVEVKGHSRDA